MKLNTLFIISFSSLFLTSYCLKNETEIEDDNEKLIAGLKPDCDLPIFKKDLIFSNVLSNCFSIMNDLLCNPMKYDRTYARNIAESLMKSCYEYFNIDSTQYEKLKELVLEKQYKGQMCEPTMNRCECGFFIEEKDAELIKYEREFRKEKIRWQIDFETCATLRDKLKRDNITASLKASDCEQKLKLDKNTLSVCSAENSNSKLLHEKCKEEVNNKTKTILKCIRTLNEYNATLASANKMIEMTSINFTRSHAELYKQYQKCNEKKVDLNHELQQSLQMKVEKPVQKLLDHDIFPYYRLSLRHMLTQEIMPYSISADLKSESFKSKFGNYDNIQPAVHITPPRQFLIGTCSAHCAEVRQRIGSGKLSDVVYFTLSKEVKDKPKYKPPTDFALDVSGKISFSRIQSPVEIDYQLLEEFVTKDNFKFLLYRRPNRNFDKCFCLLRKDNHLERLREIESRPLPVEKSKRSENTDQYAHWLQSSDSRYGYSRMNAYYNRPRYNYRHMSSYDHLSSVRRGQLSYSYPRY